MDSLCPVRVFDVGHMPPHKWKEKILIRPPPTKAAFRTKETVITRVKSKASQACHTPTSCGVHLCSLMCTHRCLCPLKLHSPLSGFSSQRAHLEMRFKTAISVELCGVRRHRSDRGVVLCPNHNSKVGVWCGAGAGKQKDAAAASNC